MIWQPRIRHVTEMRQAPLVWAVSLSLAAAGALLIAPTASAKTGTGTVLAKPSATMRVSASSSAKVVTSIPSKAKVTITCTTTGTSVKGPYGKTTIWDKITYRGKTGFVSDAQIYTGTNGAAASSCSPRKATPTPSGKWYGPAFCAQLGAKSPASYQGIAACSGSTTAAARYRSYCYGNGCRNGTDGPLPTFQCVELTGRYLYAKTGRVVWSDGRYFASRNKKIRSGLHLSGATGKINSSLKVGAVISMWGGRGYAAGHVAIVTAVTKSKVTILEQNSDAHGTARVGTISVASSGRMSYSNGYYTTFQWLTGI